MEGKKAAIYHFTNGSQKRPSAYRKELERLKDFSCKMGFPHPDIFLDRTLRKCEQERLNELLESISSYDALILKDFYHFRKNTDICMSQLVHLSKGGLKIHAIEDGDLPFVSAPFGEELRAAVYYCGLGITEHTADLQCQIMELFLREKTAWHMSGYYADLAGNKVDGSQKELYKLIEDKEDFDVVVVQSFGDIHWRTSKFCKMRHLLGKGIYSMHDDIFLPYQRGNSYEL